MEAFEAEWAAYCGTKYCVGTGNALDALRIILMSLGIGPGDEVIVPAHTFIATWLAVRQCGATPRAVEPAAGSYNIDAADVAAALTPATVIVRFNESKARALAARLRIPLPANIEIVSPFRPYQPRLPNIWRLGR